MDDPAAIYARVVQAAEHPLWEAYILPCTLGMAIKLIYKDRDSALAAFDR